jgi:hypothetical protein
MLQLNVDGTPKWYFLDEKVKGFAEKIKVGDTVSVTTTSFVDATDGNKKKDKIIFLTKEADGGASEEAAQPGAGAPASVTEKYQNQKKEFKPYGAKSPRESEKITRLSVLSSTVQIVSSMVEKEVDGLKDVEEIFGLTEDLYTRLLDKVNLDLPENEQ